MHTIIIMTKWLRTIYNYVKRIIIFQLHNVHKFLQQLIMTAAEILQLAHFSIHVHSLLEHETT